jgi:SAM-dependent methyltransferase
MMATSAPAPGEAVRCPVCDAPLRGRAIDARDRLHGTGGVHRVLRCSNCGAGVTLPRVGDERLSDFYPDDYGPYNERMSSVERVLSRAIRAFQGFNALRSAPLAALRARGPGRGLDVGCGRGDLASALRGRGWDMSGVEPSPSACAAAAARGIDVRCGTLTTVSLEPERYDAAVFVHSLEHINEPVRALELIRTALAPGGLVLITVPNFGGWQARRFGRFWFHLDVPRHRVHFTPTVLERALRTAGLEVLSVTTSSSSVGLPGSLQYRAFDRCLFPGGFGLRAVSGLAVLALPAAIALDGATGGGDLLHAVARRRPRATCSASWAMCSAGPG